MRSAVSRKLDNIKGLLREVSFPKKFVTNQTAICLLALNDEKKRDGLLPGKTRLQDGARIHDILEFARSALGIRVAENTRESYRKTSLKPLYEFGLITRHQLSTNDPNTFYRLHPDLHRVLETSRAVLGPEKLERLRRRPAFGQERRQVARKERIRVLVAQDKYFVLSGGHHNELEAAIVERFASSFMSDAAVVFLGDAAQKTGYQDRGAMRELNLPIDVTAKLPDVILVSQTARELVVAEAVVSTGVINESRLTQLIELTSASARLGYTIQFLTAFPSRILLRRFADEIAWGTGVWSASEPNNLILFQKRTPVSG